ncbi:hypothetical protein ACX27_18055 [Nostoc piscinale CENA21]|uniref:Uncharacterized protein n=1 Tax=Nostoc piscinale CENA21 TaxID=224013 RepID=A0A0M4TXU2_9NOSO|nr:hypothetical protein ACX27_18055 [Nostoc piscinale CENA21]
MLLFLAFNLSNCPNISAYCFTVTEIKDIAGSGLRTQNGKDFGNDYDNKSGDKVLERLLGERHSAKIFNLMRINRKKLSD